MKLTLTLDLSALPKQGAMFFDVARELNRAALQMSDGTYDAPGPHVGASAPVLNARGWLIGGWRITDNDEPLPVLTDEQAAALARLQAFINTQGDMGLENALARLQQADPEIANAHADEVNALEAQVAHLQRQNEALHQEIDDASSRQITPEEASALMAAHETGDPASPIAVWSAGWAKLEQIAAGER